MQKISAVLIVKNETECLAKCLDSIKGIDEIIICDTGSEDNTIEIAKKYTDKVYTDFTWCDDFSKARNHALAKATGGWILSIDADEWLHDFNEVRNTVEEAQKRGFGAVNCALIHQNSGTTHYFPRVFKKCPEVWWEGAVHNHVEMSAPYKIETLGDIKITYGYSPAHQKDPDRALRILKKEFERTGNARETYYLAMEYWYRRDFENCIKIMSQYIPKAHFLQEKADAFLILARCLWATGKHEEARSACVHALIINANFKEACLLMVALAGGGSGNATWEANARQWQLMADYATNEGVIFNRT